MFLLVLASFIFNQNPACAESIMLTAFKAKAGTPVNTTPDVALRVKRLLESEGHTVNLCILPIVYDQAAKVALECFQKINPPPRFITSIGEGDCEYALETRAANLDNTDIADDAGEVRINRPIDKTLPLERKFHFPWQRAYCSLSAADKQKVAPSTSAGNYVCNNTAFHLANELPRSVSYGFLHIPEAGCGPTQAQEAKLIHDLLSAVLSPAPAAPALLPQDCIAEYLKKEKESGQD